MTNSLNDVAQGEAEMIRAFSRANATSSHSARSLYDLAITHDATFASLLDRGIVCRSSSDPFKYYMLRQAPTLFASREQRRTVIAALRAVIMIAVALFVWRMIDLL